MLSCFLNDLTHSFIHWWIKLHTSAVTAPLIYMSVQNIRAKLQDRSCISLLCFLRSGSRVTACNGATVVICMHVMQTVWDWQTWLRACEAQSGPGTCATGKELQSISVSALRWALPQSYRESFHRWLTQDAIKCLVKISLLGNSSYTFLCICVYFTVQLIIFYSGDPLHLDCRWFWAKFIEFVSNDQISLQLYLEPVIKINQILI